MKLKKFRVEASLSQAKLAAAVGVSQPNYQRWESGSAPIPTDKLKKLAEVLEATPEALLGRHPPITTGLYDRRLSDDLNYYGEVSVHFRGGAAPLLLSISNEVFSQLYSAIQEDEPFLKIDSLANQTVIVRRGAISDLYFSSEACDDFGPEDGAYDSYVQTQIPDPRDWEIVEALAVDGEWLHEFSKEDVERVSSYVMITDDQYQQLVGEGRIKPEDLDNEREKNGKKTAAIFDLATKIRYQFSSGTIRSLDAPDPEDIYKGFWQFIEFDGVFDGAMIWLPVEGSYHRVAFINPDALDYVMLPTHSVLEGQTQALAHELDEMEMPSKPKARKSKK